MEPTEERTRERVLAEVKPQGGLDSSLQMILLDSGSFTHVCPATFAPWVPIERTTPRVGGLTASGQKLVEIGTKRVCLQMYGGVSMDVKFVVMNVSRPLLSVGELQRHGWDVVFSERSHLSRHGVAVPVM